MPGRGCGEVGVYLRGVSRQPGLLYNLNKIDGQKGVNNRNNEWDTNQQVGNTAS
jgi:hypothetical protein